MTDTTPVPFGAPVTSIDEALAEDARLAAVEVVAGERRAAIKRYIERESGMRPGFEHEAAGHGAATVTRPSRKAYVVDDDAWCAWAFLNHPDRTTSVPRVDPSVIEAAMCGELEGLPDDVTERLCAVLDEIPGAVQPEVVVAEKLLTDVEKMSTHHVTEPDGDGEKTIQLRTPDGEIVPGVEVRWASKPALRIKPDAETLDRLADTIREALAPLPALTAGDDDA